ncbi:MAG TPA: helix-turn-helix domain-containing protein [Bacteroidales bacterium]|nr:helix-turn-helix domain-containing protein [Bacteroidales bacterium]HPS63583.1 helix-turn-helix domain-containing protein [Bacteroidales bacterium]
MIQLSAIQELLFRSIRNKLPSNISFVHEISEMLGISYDSAYRRIRGEKELPLEELKRICLHYNISVDQLFNLKSDHMIFSSLAVGQEGLDIEKWIRTLLDAIRVIHAARDKEIIYAAKDIPVFYYFEFPEIAAFKLYFWNKTLIPAGGYEHALLSLDPSPSLYEAGRQMLMHYVKIPTVEIWSEETVSSILRQIEYCYVSGFFKKAEDTWRLCDVLHTWLDHVQHQAEQGFQYMYEKPAEGVEGNFRLFRNEVLVTDNTILVTADGRRTSYNTYNVINQLITTNPVFCSQVEFALRNLMQHSTLISGTSAKERYSFFNILHEKVETLRHHLKHT